MFLPNCKIKDNYTVLKKATKPSYEPFNNSENTGIIKHFIVSFNKILQAFFFFSFNSHWAHDTEAGQNVLTRFQ